MSFFDDLLSWGDVEAPQQTIIPTNQLFSQGFGALNNQIAPGLVGWNAALAGTPGATSIPGIGLGVNDQISPYINQNVAGAQKYYLDQLNMGENLSPELMADLTRDMLATGAARSGYGASPGGLGGTAVQTALARRALGQERAQNALAAGSQGFNLGRQLFDPQKYTDLGAQMFAGVTNQIQNEQTARDRQANIQRATDLKNSNKWIETGAELLGMAVGGYLGSYGGNTMGGIQTGGAVGKKLAGTRSVAGVNLEGGGSQPGSDGAFTSFLGGQQWGIGGGRSQGAYADEYQRQRAMAVPAMSV